ncbi:MAG TPA: NAD-binding protein [Candidatus Limnocylindria bacterium]|jgi:voltage-gated potassium channel|nr:NAD-binding protein [Candidatus Limnocylindria bacterium]
MPGPLRILFAAPFMRRVGFHVRRISGGLDRHFFVSLLLPIIGFVVLAAAAVTLLEEEKRTFGGFGSTFYWAITTVIGSGDSSYVTSPGGFVIGWLLAFFGVAIVAAMTGAVVGFVIDFLLKEGQGMGAAGFRDHIVVCGWNGTARELIEELKGDEFKAKVVVLHDAERNPAGSGVYFVRGDTTSAEDLERAGISEAASAVVFPTEQTNEADMRSILTVMAIEAVAPEVRTVVEVNNPQHVEHMQRAKADEVLVTSRLASRLLARSALYPGLTEIMADIVSGGTGSELYRVRLPDAYVGLSVDEIAARLRGEHHATLLAITRGGRPFINPPADFKLELGDDAVVVAESLGTLAPLRLQHDQVTAPADVGGALQPAAAGD